MSGASPSTSPIASPTAPDIPEPLATAPPPAPEPVLTALPTAPDPVHTAPPPAPPCHPPPPIPPHHNINPFNPFNPFNNPPIPPPIPPPVQPPPHIPPPIVPPSPIAPQPPLNQPQPYYHHNFAQPHFPNAPFHPQQQFYNNNHQPHFFNNNQPYLPHPYLPMHTNNSDSNIPTTTHIQELKSRADWAAWYQGIENVLMACGLLNHICKPPAANVPWTVLNAPSYPPTLPPGYIHAHVLEWQTWYWCNAIAFGIITLRLSREILGMIPSIQDPSTGTRRTAREALQLLRQQYGGGNLQYALLTHKQLSLMFCNSISRIPSFVQAWSSLAQTLRDTAGYPLSYAALSLDVVNMLPAHFQEQ